MVSSLLAFKMMAPEPLAVGQCGVAINTPRQA